MTIIERIIRIADEKRVKKADLYRSCGIPQSTFSGWVVANVKSIPSEYVVSIADFFGISCDELLTGQKSMGGLTDNQAHLVNEFSDLDWDGQQMVLATLINEKRRMEQVNHTEG